MWSARPFNANMPDPFGRNSNTGDGKPFSAESTKCPSCGSNIFYMPEVQGMVCRNCGNIYHPATLELMGSLGYTIEHDYSSDEDISDDDRKRHEIVCDSCGAVMIADEHTMSTMCPFCGSPAIITRLLTREFRPDYIIPFKIDRDTAQNNVKNWLKSRKMTPWGFKSKSRLTKLTAMYVPFWLLDCGVNSDMTGTAIRKGKEFLEKYHVASKASYYVKDVPFDASVKIANKLMEAIEPFDYSGMVKFDNRYLQGFCADKYDQRPTEIMDRFIKRLDRFSSEFQKNVSNKFDYYVPNHDKTFTWMSDLQIKYCLLPVWFMTIEFDGRQYQVAVNGQTGEAGGMAPTTSAVDKFDGLVRFTRSKWISIPIGLAVVIALVLFNISLSMDVSPLMRNTFYTLSVIELLLVAALAAMFIALGVAKLGSKAIHKRADEVNDFDKDPGLSVYLDTSKRSDLKMVDFVLRHREYYDERRDDEEEERGLGDLFETY